MQALMRDAHDLYYFAGPDILNLITPKVASSALLEWMYRGMTGRSLWDWSICATYIQNLTSPCWSDHSARLYTRPAALQWKALTASKTLRVAVQHDRYERLLSALKSKLTCEAAKYSTDKGDVERIATTLRQQAHRHRLPRRVAGMVDSCMNLTEFADSLDVLRLDAGKEGWVSTLRLLDESSRPQEVHAGEIDYDLIVDVRRMGDRRVWRLVERNVAGIARLRGEANGVCSFLPTGDGAPVRETAVAGCSGSDGGAYPW